MAVPVKLQIDYRKENPDIGRLYKHDVGVHRKSVGGVAIIGFQSGQEEAHHADIWNGFGPSQRCRHKSEVLDRWCAEVGRNPAEIERSAMTALGTTAAHTARTLDPLVEAGASHIIMNLRAPWKLNAVEKLVRWRDSRR